MRIVREKIETLINFITKDIWKISLLELTKGKALAVKYLRIIILSVRGFNEDKCQLRASALTFYTLLSIVPVFAMLFGIAKGFGFEKILEKQLLEKFAEHETVVLKIIDFSISLLKNTRGGVIAGIGVVLLIWAVVKVLGHIELSFNDIWNVKTTRSFTRKIADYLSIMLISPIFLILSSGIAVFITSQIEMITKQVSFLGIIAPLIFLALKLLPYLLMWLFFCFIYLVIPNTKVKFGAGFLAAVVAGTIFQVVQFLYIYFQVGVAKYNAIYGSFAALPLFLIWLQLSWLVVLFGAEISFAVQNVDTYEFELEPLQISPFSKKLFSLLIAHLVVKNFSKGEKPLAAPQMSHVLGLPIRLVHQILFTFVNCRLFSKVETQELKEPAYQPARDINFFSVNHVVEALEKEGTDNIPVTQTNELKTISETLEKFSDTITQSPTNRLLKDI